MKIYTRTGDDGSTGLFGAGRVAKSDPRIEAFGAIDELNAQVGIARTLPLPPQCDEVLNALQNRMFDLGAELATPDANARGTASLQDTHVAEVERWIDQFESELPPLRAFILPGGSPGAAALHLARCICRRAERRVIALAQLANVRPTVLRYVNRVSDLLFVMARFTNAELGQTDVLWQKIPKKDD